MTRQILEAIKRAEENLGVQLRNSEIAETLMYTVNKCKYLGKDAEYFPVLLQTELENGYMRRQINSTRRF